MKVKVKVDLRPKVKSRKVNKYVRLWDTWVAVDTEATRLRQELNALQSTLTGGQLAEAQKILQ